MASPFVGPGYDYVWSVLAVLAVGLLGAGLVRWFRRGEPDLLALLQLLVIVVVPILGPAAYLLGTAGGRARGSSTARMG